MAYTITEQERQRRRELMRQIQERKAQRAIVPPNPDINIRRFGLGDLESMGMWLCERLMKHFPHLNERIFAGWLRGLVTNNAMFFCRTNDAVAMAQLTHWPLDPVPYLEEIFVLVRNDALEEGAALYTAMRRWAVSANATEMVVERFSDVPREMIVKAIGKVTDYELSIVSWG